MSTKKIVKEITTNQVDANGEYFQISNYQELRVPAEPDFIKIYLKDINKLFELPKGCSPALYEIIKRMGYDGKIVLNKYIKQECAEASGLSLQSINNYVTDFVKKNIIKRLGTGVYEANPNLFGKGSWTDICKRRELYITIRYSDEGKEIVAHHEAPEQSKAPETPEVIDKVA